MGGEDRFRVNFSEEGASKLAATLTHTLKDYMGDDFIDDTLVKYVIVLLGNGRSKEEVKEDLDVFLGDNTPNFVTWLWDHLASNLHLYVESAKPPSLDPNPKIKPLDKPKSKPSTTRLLRDSKSFLLHNPPPHTSVSTLINPVEDKAPAKPRKRNRPPDPPHFKRDAPRATVAAPRRLLQFAVREAVATAWPSSSVSEPARKRLRSVVSTSTGISTEDVRHQRIESVAKLSNPMTTALRAAAEAAEDVRRVKAGNVFDRLRRVSGKRSEHLSYFGEPAVPETEYEDCDEIHDNARETCPQTKEYTEHYNVNASVMDSNTGLASDSASDNEGYDNPSVPGGRMMTISETGTSRGEKTDDSLTVQYSVAQNTDEMIRLSRKKDQEQTVSAASTKHKIVNISVNVNTWKPSHYQPAREIVEVGTPESTQKINNGVSNSNVQVMKDNNTPVTIFENGKPAEPQRENQKAEVSSASGLYSVGRPLEDADSRTIFVNNVHFAATKDTLSRHFNKFGQVLKVIILNDAATGCPKGSAYVEFMRKEAAESALTLDGTSFMSRIIKVAKKSSGQQESSPMTTWPRIARSSPFNVSRYAQVSFPRVFLGAYRGRPGMKPGARSMQWKRDSQQTSAESLVSVSGNTTNSSSTGRGLTYVRAESKPDGNTGRA